MNEKVKVIYYVDIEDNIKNSLCAIPSDKDIRNSEIINEIADVICDTFAWDLTICDNCTNISKAIAHHDFASINEYEFGVEEITLIKD